MADGKRLKISLTPKIDESKLKAFTAGRMSVVQKTPFQLRKEEQERKKREDEKAAAAVFAEFAASFADDGPSGPTQSFVREGGTGAYGSRKRSRSPERKKPVSAMDIFDDEEEEAPVKQEKKRSNMASFMEQLKRSQEHREARKERRPDGSVVDPLTEAPPRSHGGGGSFDTGDPSTTNLFVGNLSPNMTEAVLAQTFGAYGPLASVKIMWPRTMEEKSRGRMTGFVAFMDKDDASEALEELQDAEMMGHVMRLGWSKAVPIPPAPFYAGTRDPKKKRKPAMFIRPPPKTRKTIKVRDPTMVQVWRPRDKARRQLIHRMIEFVVRFGPEFEAEIVKKKATDPDFAFLLAFDSAEHIYYRWKLFSVLQGEPVDNWSQVPFRMIKDGRQWQPPSDDDSGLGKGDLSVRELSQLERMVHSLTTERRSIADAMVWCLRRAYAAEQVVDCVTESLCKLETPPPCKIARLFLVSDLLHNASAHVPNASFYRTGFLAKLPAIFPHLKETYRAISGRLRAEKFKTQVMSCLRFWSDNNMCTPDYIANLEKEFLAQPANKAQPAQPDEEEDVDGEPLEEDEDVDGVPMDVSDDDVDGVPL
eukprot:m.488678 g.488678  ORF g.488678 m.488678 type:complete len:591 (+) comp26016_c0_seq1:149-1921(+)